MFSDWQSYLVLKVIVKTTLHQHCASIANVSWSLEDDSASGLSFFLSSSPGMSTFHNWYVSYVSEVVPNSIQIVFGSFFAFGIDIKGYWLARRLCALPIFAARLRSRMLRMWERLFGRFVLPANKVARGQYDGSEGLGRGRNPSWLPSQVLDMTRRY